MPLPVLNKLVWEEKMSEQPKTKAMKSASTGSTCAFLGIILGGPLLGIPAIIRFCSGRTHHGNSGTEIDDGSREKARAGWSKGTSASGHYRRHSRICRLDWLSNLPVDTIEIYSTKA